MLNTNKQENKENKKIKERKEKEKDLEHIPQNTKLLSLILIIILSQSIHNQIQK